MEFTLARHPACAKRTPPPCRRCVAPSVYGLESEAAPAIRTLCRRRGCSMETQGSRRYENHPRPGAVVKEIVLPAQIDGDADAPLAVAGDIDVEAVEQAPGGIAETAAEWVRLTGGRFGLF